MNAPAYYDPAVLGELGREIYQTNGGARPVSRARRLPTRTYTPAQLADLAAKARVRASTRTAEIRRARSLLLAGNLGAFGAVPVVASQLWEKDASGKIHGIRRTFNFSLYHVQTQGPSLRGGVYAKDAAWDRVKPIPWTGSELRKLWEYYQKKFDWRSGCERIDMVLSTQASRQLARGVSPGMQPVAQVVGARLPPVNVRPCKEQPTILDAVKKTAILVGAAVGTAIVGNAIMGAVAKGASATTAAGAAGTAGASAPAAVAAGEAAAAVTAGAAFPGGAAGAVVAKGAAAGGALLAGAKKYAPVAEDVINGTAMVRAIKDGEMPPPPISLGDGNFTDYARVVTEKVLERKIGRELEEREREMVALESEYVRRYMAQFEPRHAPVVNTGLNATVTEAQRQRADAALLEGRGDITTIALAVGIPLLAVMAGG